MPPVHARIDQGAIRHHPVSANRTFPMRRQIGRFCGDFRAPQTAHSVQSADRGAARYRCRGLGDLLLSLPASSLPAFAMLRHFQRFRILCADIQRPSDSACAAMTSSSLNLVFPTRFFSLSLLLDEPQPRKTNGYDHHDDENGVLDHRNCRELLNQ